jgi:hypothetical protein
MCVQKSTDRNLNRGELQEEVVGSSMVGRYTVLGVLKAGGLVVILGYRLFSFWLPALGIALVPYGALNRPKGGPIDGKKRVKGV